MRPGRRIAGRAASRLRRFDRHLLASDPQRSISSIVVAAVVLFVPLFSALQVSRAASGGSINAGTVVAAVPVVDPLLSVRRIATTAASDARSAATRARLATLVTRLPGRSCLLASVDGRVLASQSADVALAPASNMKLLVAATALDVLGAEHRFETRLVGKRFGATIVGDLWLVGGGDPLLSTRAYPPTQRFTTISPTYLDALADELAAGGVRIVSGSVVGDESRYDDERFVPSWGDGIRAIEAGPLSALLVDDGILLGEPLKPANPAVAAATAFTRLLEARGIRVFGAPQSGPAPPDGEVLARLVSAPLAASLVDLLTNSDNNAAELLLKEIGLARLGLPTRVSGLQVVADSMAARGVPMEGVVLVDGSGLSADNRVTCATLHALLTGFGPTSPIGQSLALAGTTGTLQDVLTSGPADGTVRAKTGTLHNVKSLSGFFPTGGEQIAFALILTNPGISNRSAYRPLWDEMMRAFDAYRLDPRTEQLLPR